MFRDPSVRLSAKLLIIQLFVLIANIIIIWLLPNLAQELMMFYLILSLSILGVLVANIYFFRLQKKIWQNIKPSGVTYVWFSSIKTIVVGMIFLYCIIIMVILGLFIFEIFRS